jgi:hypothetical protein
MPDFDKKWFLDWALNYSEFNRLFDYWVSKKYNKWCLPSLDREDSTVPYTKGNVRWITWKENHHKGRTVDRLNGTVPKMTMDKIGETENSLCLDNEDLF